MSLAGCATSSSKRTDFFQDSYRKSVVEQEASWEGGETRRIEENEVRPGFLFELSHPEDRKLSGKYRVSFEGDLELPYRVRIRAGGITLEQLRSKVQAAYQSYFKAPGELTFRLIERQYWVEVRGLVTKPGRYLVKPTTSLDELIAQAQGFFRDSSVRYVKFVREERIRVFNLERYFKSGQDSGLPSWVGGETLFFQSEAADFAAEGKNQVELLGEVKNPGDLTFKEGADFFYYLQKAGGPTNAARLEKIQIFRGPEGQKQWLEFGIEEVEKMPRIAPGDLILVSSTAPTRSERWVQLGAGVLSVINTIILLIIAL